MGSVDWIKIRREFETTGITLKDLATKHGIKEGTMRSRKNREGWQAQRKRVATKKVRCKDREKIKSAREILAVDNPELTERQRLFCLYYIKNFNATMAAIKAGYEPSRAHVTGSELVRNRKVAAEIRRLKGAIQEELFIDALDVLNRYIKIAFADMTDFVEFRQEEVPVIGMFGSVEVEDPETGEKKPLTKMVNVIKFKDSTQVDGGLICQIKQSKDGASIKLEDRQKALDKLAQYFDLFPDKFQRRIEEEELRIAQQKLDLEKLKADAGVDNAGIDDGFMEALRGTAIKVWEDEE